MKTYSTLLLLLMLLNIACKKPSNNTLDFEKTYGGLLEDKANKILFINESLYVFGTTKSFNDSNGDFYLLKLDLDGNLIWEKNYGGSGSESGRDLLNTSDGNLILVGITESFGNGLKDVYAVKVDLEGNILWESSYGGTQDDDPKDIIELSNGEICIVGRTRSFNAGTDDIYMLWLDQNGNFIREKNHGNLDIEACAEVLELEHQELMLFAHKQSGGEETRDYYLLKTSLIGDSLWSRIYGGNAYEESQDFERTADGEFILCGHSASTDPMHNMYTTKIDENGNVIWENNYGGAMHDGGQAILINQDGNYVMVARSMSFGSGDRNAYMVITNTNGTILSDKVIGGKLNDRIDDIVETDNNYFLVGHSNSYSANGNDDVYLVRLKK